jgi:dihydropteroate synthase
MGILNVTPDSFFDGGRFLAVAHALEQARRMVAEGARIIDVGGESTRPGAVAVSAQHELDRVVPVIEAIRRELDVIISIDTSKAEVIEAAAAAGAGFINDVRALALPRAAATAARLGLPVCLMHMRGEPTTMQRDPNYADVVAEVKDYLSARVADCAAAGIPQARIVIDPGFGFGKTVAHNLELMRTLPALLQIGCPLLVGVSRKSFIGHVLGHGVEQRLFGSVALAGLAVWLGAAIIRTHDVAATRDAVRMVAAVRDVRGI